VRTATNLLEPQALAVLRVRRDRRIKPST